MTLVNTTEKYQLPTGVGSGQWAVASGQVIQARFGGKTIECPLVGSKGDTLMVNHGLIASANVSKVNIWAGSSELMGLLDLCKRLCMQYYALLFMKCFY